MIYDDKPIASSENDILERAVVAAKLAEAIATYEDESSFVIGIQGKWGDGKTSFINMMLNQGAEKKKGALLDSRKFLIVNFNPWYFTGEDQILRQFLGLLSEKIATIPDSSDVIKEASKLIKRLSSVVKPLQPVLDIGGTFLGFPGAGIMADKILDKAGEFSQNLEEAFQPTEDVIQIKEEIGNALKKINYKILIVIDDIDRLNKKEIYDIFRLVKVIADFPNTIYFLSYDKSNVCSALSQYGHDERFIDKIVQHEFDIPRISEEKISSFLDKVFLEIAEKHELEINEQDKQYYGHLVYSGLKHPVRNLREAKRILNKVNFEYGCLRGEVNFFDLLGVTVLKLYAPKFYDFLLLEGSRYLRPMGISTNEKDVYKKFKEEVGVHKSWENSLLEALFPHIVKHPDMSAGAIGKHLYSEEHFNKYFQLAVVGDQISEFEYGQPPSRSPRLGGINGWV